MNKFYSLFLLFSLTISSAFAGIGCSIDTTNTQFFNPAVDSIPCVERTIGYNQTILIHVPKTIDVGPFVGAPFPVILTIDSMRIDSITGLPTGLGYSLNPFNGFFKGGDNGCALVFGNTSDPTGHYPLTTYGTISVSGIPQGFGFPPDTTFPLQQVQSQSALFSLYVDVINPGDPCRPQTGIKNFNAQLNSLIQVYPNPSNGIFELKLNAGGLLNGEVVVMDINGRKVFAQSVETIGLYNTSINLSNCAKGLYTLQLRTAEGFVSKNISLE